MKGFRRLGPPPSKRRHKANQLNWLLEGRFEDPPAATAGGGGGNGVVAPSFSGGGGGGGGGGMSPPPSSPPMNLSGPAYTPPPAQPIQQPQGGGPPQPGGGQQLNGLAVSPALQGAIDGTGPGYQPQPGQPPVYGTPGQPLGSVPQPGQQQQQPVDWNGIRQTLTRYGVPIPETVTPEQGFAQIAQALQGQSQRNYLTDLGQAAYEHWGEFQQWQQERAAQQQQQQRQQQQNSPWNPPQFDRNWLNMVEMDQATGRVRARPGFDPGLGTRVQSYMDYIQDQQQQMWDNPQQYMWRMVQPLVSQAMQEGVQQNLGQYQEQVQAQSLIDRNKDWLFNKDQSGRVIYTPQGQPQLSANGVRYHQYITEAAQTYGMRSIEAQNNYAISMIERDTLRARAQQWQAQQQGNPAFGSPQPQNGLPNRGVPGQQPAIPAGGGHQPNVQGNQPFQGGPFQPQPATQPQHQPQAGMSLVEMMRQDFANEGITDQEISRDFRSGMFS